MGLLSAQSTEETTSASGPTEASGGEQPAVPVGDAEAATEEGSQRTELNLLGQIDAASGEAQRNENVSLTLIDNNVLKELNRRMGTTATIVREFQAERKYFGMEFGGSASRAAACRWRYFERLSRPIVLDSRQQLFQSSVIFSSRGRSACSLERI